MPDYTSPFFSGFSQGQGLWANMQAMKAARQASERADLEGQEKLKQMQFENAPSGMSMRSMGLPGVSPMGPTNTPEGTPMGNPASDAILPNRAAIPFQEKLMLQQQQREQNKANKQMADSQKNEQRSQFSANQFRDEFNQKSKQFEIIAPMYKNVIASATTPNPTAATDMGLIFSYMKILDPNSTVREGEYATAANAGSIPDAIRNQFNRVKDGEKLQPGQRSNFAKSAQMAFKSASGIQNQHISRYTDLAKRKGVDPRDVVYDYGAGMGQESFDAPNIGLEGSQWQEIAPNVRIRRKQ